jgi:hypothetical protein
VLKIIARENLVLATGHVHAEEVVAVTKRARELGVKNILVTHGLTNIPGLSTEQAKQVAQMGGYIEICYLQFLTGPTAQYPWMTHWDRVDANTGDVTEASVRARLVTAARELFPGVVIQFDDKIVEMIGAL